MTTNVDSDLTLKYALGSGNATLAIGAADAVEMTVPDCANAVRVVDLGSGVVRAADAGSDGSMSLRVSKTDGIAAPHLILPA